MKPLNTTCILYNKKLADILGDDSKGEVDARIRINLLEISTISEYANDSGDIEPGMSLVFLRGGETLVVRVGYDKLLSLWEQASDYKS